MGSLIRRANFVFYTEDKPHETIPARYKIGFYVTVWTGIIGDLLLDHGKLPGRLLLDVNLEVKLMC